MLPIDQSGPRPIPPQLTGSSGPKAQPQSATNTAVNPQTNPNASTYTPPSQPKYAPVTPIDPVDLPETTGAIRMGVSDGNQVVDALNQGGPAAAAQKLKQLILQDANLHNPDHASYASALVGATAPDIAQSLDNDPANAAQNWQTYLNAGPASDPQARSNLVITALKAAKTPEAQQAIINGSASVVQQQAATPAALSSFLSIVSDPAQRSQLAAEAAPAIAQQVQAKASSDPAGAAALLDQYVSAAPDAASRTAILKACAPAIGQMETKINADADASLNQLSPGDYGADAVITSLSHAASLAGPDGTKAITDALAQNAGDAQFTDYSQTGGVPRPWARAFQQLAQTNGDTTLPFEASLQSSLQAAGKGRPAGELQQELDTQNAAYLSSAKGKYDDAKGKVDKDNEDLSTELARLGPGLTDAQKQKYIEAFHKAHAGDYQAEADAAKSLGQALNLVGPSALKNTDPDFARTALDAASELAETPEGAEAAKNFVSLVENNTDSPLYNNLRVQLGGQADGVKAKCEDILKKAVPNLYAHDVTEANGDASAASEKLKEQLESLETCKDLGDDANQLVQGVAALQEAAQTGKYDALTELGEGPLGMAFKGAGVILGIAKAANGDSDPTAYVQNLAATGQEGCELIAEATKSLSGTLPAVADAGEMIGKFAPGLGLVANALATSEDFQALVKGGNAGDVVKLLGDSISTLGSALEVTGIGAVVGVPLQVLGSLVSIVGGLISGNAQEDHWNDEEKNLLGQIGLPTNVAQGLTAADPESLDQVAKDEKLSPEQVQQLATDHPEIFEAPGYAQAFVDAANACGISGGDLDGFATALAKDNPQYMSLLFAQRENADPSQSASHSQALRAVLLGNPSSAAYQYVQQKNPSVLSANGQQQQKADIDYQNRGMGGDPWMQMGNYFKQNSDPSYQAELIKDLQKDGMLDNFIQMMGQQYGYNGWPEAVRQGVQAAAAQGVISQADAQRYLSELPEHSN